MTDNSAPGGWKDIIAPLLEQAKLEGIHVAQVKEKFGALRFYLDGAASPALEEAILQAERQSRVTCEECGAHGQLRKNKSGWLRTLCDEHAKGSDEKESFRLLPPHA